MKNILLCFCLLLPVLSIGQSKMNLSVHQDFRLLLFGDDRGNGIFTPDLQLKLEVDAFTFNYSNVLFYLGVEYAYLSSNSFNRFYIGLGYITEFPFLKKFNFGVLLDHGLIFRAGESFMGLSANAEVTYPVAKKLRLSVLYQAIDRNDLTTLFNTHRNIKGSVFLGLKMEL